MDELLIERQANLQSEICIAKDIRIDESYTHDMLSFLSKRGDQHVRSRRKQTSVSGSKFLLLLSACRQP